MLPYTPDQLFAAHEIASIAGHGGHEILGDDPTESQRSDFGHVRRPARFYEQL